MADAHEVAALRAEVARLTAALECVARMTDALYPDSYRRDDHEGCLDAVYAICREALAPPPAPAEEASAAKRLHSIRCASYTSPALLARGHRPGACDCGAAPADAGDGGA